jgi:hypothetical protein
MIIHRAKLPAIAVVAFWALFILSLHLMSFTTRLNQSIPIHQQEHHTKFRRRLQQEETYDGPIEPLIPQSEEALALTPEEITEKHIKNYLGGLYPKVDRQFLPIYLKDTKKPREIDPKWGEIVDGDVPFYWHIPKASGSTMKNIMNFCFNLKRAEKVVGEPVS